MNTSMNTRLNLETLKQAMNRIIEMSWSSLLYMAVDRVAFLAKSRPSWCC